MRRARRMALRLAIEAAKPLAFVLGCVIAWERMEAEHMGGQDDGE